MKNKFLIIEATLVFIMIVYLFYNVLYRQPELINNNQVISQSNNLFNENNGYLNQDDYASIANSIAQQLLNQENNQLDYCGKNNCNDGIQENSKSTLNIQLTNHSPLLINFVTEKSNKVVKTKIDNSNNLFNNQINGKILLELNNLSKNENKNYEINIENNFPVISSNIKEINTTTHFMNDNNQVVIKPVPEPTIVLVPSVIDTPLSLSGSQSVSLSPPSTPKYVNKNIQTTTPLVDSEQKNIQKEICVEYHNVICRTYDQKTNKCLASYNTDYYTIVRNNLTCIKYLTNIALEPINNSTCSNNEMSCQTITGQP